MFTYADGETVANVYRKRLEKNLTSVPIADNYFLHYSLTGKYGNVLPPYLEEHGYTQLRNTPLDILSITTKDVLSYLRELPSDSISKFNLSDIFEPLSVEQNDALWEQIVRTAKKGAFVAYWNNLVVRTYPAYMAKFIYTDNERLTELRCKDRVFFYDSFHVHTILK